MMSKANHWLGCNQVLCGRIFRRTSPIRTKFKFCVQDIQNDSVQRTRYLNLGGRLTGILSLCFGNQRQQFNATQTTLNLLFVAIIFCIQYHFALGTAHNKSCLNNIQNHATRSSTSVVLHDLLRSLGLVSSYCSYIYICFVSSRLMRFHNYF